MATVAYTQDYDGNYPAVISATFTNGETNETDIALWHDLLHPYINSRLLACPSRRVSQAFKKETFACGYAINRHLNDPNINGNTTSYAGKNESAAQIQSSLVLIFDAKAGILAIGNPDTSPVSIMYPDGMEQEVITQKPGALRHGGGGNYGFADGHAKWFRPEAFGVECDGTKPCFKP